MQTINIIIVGDKNVGKSSIMLRYVEDIQYKTIPTIAINHMRKDKVCLWDASGNETFIDTTKHFYKNAHAIIFVYDISKPESFFNIKKWDRICDESDNPDCLRYIIGNKTDLENIIQPKYVNSIFPSMKHFQVSAKTGKNIKAVIDIIAKETNQFLLLSEDINCKDNECLIHNSESKGVKSFIMKYCLCCFSK